MFFRRMFSRKDNGSSSPPPPPPSITDNRSISIVQKSPLKRRSSSGDDKRGVSVLQLTPLWEHIIRTRTLPDNLSPAEMFEEFLERLRDPEWQVRQHALRVLIDVLIVIGQKADTYFGPIVPQLVENLGHPAPTVRKGALDALRVYIAETAMPETILLEIMDIGLNQRITTEPFGGRLTCGVMLSLPSLVQATLHTSKRNYILRSTIDMLVNKMTQVTHQEITLKVLLRIRDLIGPREFSEYMSHGAYREFELLCNVYGLNEEQTLVNSTRSSWHAIPSFDQESGESSSNQAESFWRTDEDELFRNDDDEKIIMETEIKINDDTLTMRILESNEEPVEDGATREICSDDEEEITAALENSGLIHVLSDSELDEINNNADMDYVRRTPKRVTFGGEIVKMRTPDSDTTVQSDVDSALRNTVSKLDNLNFLTVDIPSDNTKPPQRPKSAQISPTRSSESPVSPRRLPSDEPRTKSASPFRRISISPVDSIVSPKPMHKEIEVMHNLQRSPCVSPPRTSRQNSISNELDAKESLPNTSQSAPSHLPAIKSWEDLGIVGQNVLSDLKSGDWRHRLQAVAAIENVLKSSETLAQIQPHLDSFLRMLLSSEKSPEVAEDKRRIVMNLISRLPLDNLENRSTQIITGLCRQGGSGSNRVSKALMQRLPPSFIVLKLLSDDFVHARSSRFRENALQMVMYALMTFPSTCFDTATCIARTVHAALDRKKRVRQASLDVLAILGQVTSPRTVMESVQTIAGSRENGNDLCAAVKARLSRKQLPIVGIDGSVQYALRVPSPQYNDPLPDPNMGADVEWIVSGIGSVSPTSLKRRSQRFMRSSKPIGIQQDRCNEKRLKAPHEILALGVGGKPVDDFISSSSSFQGNSDDTDDSRTNLQFSLATGNSLQHDSVKITNGGSVGGDIFGIYGKRIASRSHLDLLNDGKSSNSDSSGGKNSKLPVTSRFPAMERFDVTGVYVDRQSFRNPYEQNFSLYRVNSSYPKVNYSGVQRKISKGNYAQEPFSESKFDESRPTSQSAYETATTAIPNPKRFMNVEKFIMQSNKQQQQQQQQQYPQQKYTDGSNQERVPLDHQHPPTSESKIFNKSVIVANRVPSSKSITRVYDEQQNISSGYVESSGQESEEQCSSNHSTPTKIVGDASPASNNSRIDNNNVERSNTPSSKSVVAEIITSRPESVASKKEAPTPSPLLPLPTDSIPQPSVIENTETRLETPVSEIPPLTVDEVDNTIQNLEREETQPTVVLVEVKEIDLEKTEETDLVTVSIIVEEEEPIKETVPDRPKSENDDGVEETTLPTPKTPTSETLVQPRSPTPGADSIRNIFESPLPIRSVSVASLNQIPPLESLPPTNPPTPIPSKQSPNLEQSSAPENITTKSTESLYISTTKVDLDSKSTASTTSSEYPPSHATSLDEPIRSKCVFTNVIKPPHLPLIRKSKTTLFGRNRRVSPAKQSIKLNQTEVFPQSLTKFDKPKDALNQSLNQIESTEWETVIVGLRSLVRIMRYHPDILDAQMHIVCMQLGKAVRNLRSQVSRAACQAATELFTIRTKFLEQECDDLVGNLLHRTADTNRFLRGDAMRSLESMCDYLAPSKIIQILSTRGAIHQNAAVRTTAAKLLNRLTDRIGHDRVFNMNRDHRDKLLVMGANLLLEGSLETRNYTKAMFHLLAEHASFGRIMKEVIPTRTYRNIEKTLKSIR